MNYLEQTKDELTQTIKELQQEYESLQAAFEKNILDHRKVKEELEESQLLLRSSIESSRDMIILAIDRNYRYSFFNSYHREVMLNAYGKEIQVGMNLLHCITDEDDRRKSKSNYDRAFKGESHMTIEEYGDLDRSYYETRYNPIFNDDLEVIGVTIFSSNISTRKQAEIALKKSEEQYRLLFNKMMNGSAMHEIICNANGEAIDYRFIEANKAFGEMTGLNVQEIIGKTCLEVIPDIEKFWIEKYGEVALSGKSVRFEQYAAALEKHFEVTAYSTAPGTFVTIFEDVTERIKSEKALKRSMELLSYTEKIGKVGGWEVDIDKMSSSWTDEVYHIHEIELNSDPNVQEGIHFYTPESRPLIEKAVQRAIEFGEPFDLELEIITAKGNRRNVHSIGRTDLENRRIFGFFQDITQRKQAEARIREQDQEFRKLSANVPDLIFQFTRRPDGTYFVPIASEGIRNIFGCAPEDLLEDFGPISKVVHPEDLEPLIREIEFSATHLTYYTSEFRVQIPGRDVQWIYCNSTPERLPDGSITWYGFSVNITQKKLSEEALKEKSLRLELAMEAANMAWWEMNISTGEVILDHRKSEMLGYPEDKVPDYQEFWHLIHLDDRKKVLQAMEDMNHSADGEIGRYEVEFRMLTQSGQYKWFYDIGTTIEDADGTAIKIAGLTMDITDRKLAEGKIRELNERIATATRSAGVGIWDWNIADNQIVWDDEMYTLYGLREGEKSSVFEAWENRIHPGDKEFNDEETRLALEGVKAYSSEFRIVLPDGTIRHLKAKGEVFYDDDGKPIRMLGVNFDITEQKQAEENIQMLNDELEERVLDRTAQLEASIKELESFSYSVSHDLRAPLRHINGYIQLLNNRFHDQLPEKAQYYLNTVANAAKQMGTLIDDLLQFSRTGRQEMQKVQVDMNALVQEVLETIAPDLKNRKIELTVQKMPVVCGDYAMLKQVWLNLLDNAVKYTKPKESAKIAVGYTKYKGKFLFSIQDNGVGFDMQYAHRLFGVFHRLHSPTEFEGTGIGLANVQRIIVKHGGKVWANAQLNEGATFFFSLPVNKEIQS